MPPPPNAAGLSLKPVHYDAALRCNVQNLWFEVHSENYLMEGGPRLSWLQGIRENHAVSLHGVGLSLAGNDAPNTQHLAKVKHLINFIEPAIVSEHLAWSVHKNVYYPDLLPVPRTHAALLRLARHVQQTQEYLGCNIAIENPAHYLTCPSHEYSELDFLRELCQRTGCNLLIDINNIWVGAHNLSINPEAYIDDVPGEFVREIHLAGHTQDLLPEQRVLLIDSHDQPIAPEVWALFERLIRRIGRRPTLIERDSNIPDFASFLEERDKAQSYLTLADTGTPNPTQKTHASPTNTPLTVTNHFYDDFVTALVAQDPLSTIEKNQTEPSLQTQDPCVAHFTEQRAFWVYKNTTAKGCIDAVQDNFPAVTRLLGTERLRSAAEKYRQTWPPTHPSLIDYGNHFPEFLRNFEPAKRLPVPYLADLAQLERYRTEAHLSKNAIPLEPKDLVDHKDLAHTSLHLHPTTRWFQAEFSVVSIWNTLMEEHEPSSSVPFSTQPAHGPNDAWVQRIASSAWIHPGIHACLVTRGEEVVVTCEIPLEYLTFLDACARGEDLMGAVASTLSIAPTLDVQSMLDTLFDLQAFERKPV